MTPTQVLKAEHEGILTMLGVFEKIRGIVASSASIPAQHLDEILVFFKEFIDTCHHGKEEKFLFPALQNAGVPREGGPIGVMLTEHETGRKYVRQMREIKKKLSAKSSEARSEFAETAGNYIELLRNHIHKENTVLFQIADKVLAKTEQNRLVEQFNRLEREEIGEGRHESFHSLIDTLSRTYGS
ncbi:MAG: hemerythrin domain-containing protein [Thermodesulfobacteriota bacterium]